MHARGDVTVRRDAQRLFLDTASPAVQQRRRIGIHERGETALECAIDAGDGHVGYQGIRPRKTSHAMVKSPRRL